MANSARHLDRPLSLLTNSFHLDDEHRLGIARQAHRRAPLHRFDGRSVHHFQGGGDDPRARDVDDGLRGMIHLVKDSEQRAH